MHSVVELRLAFKEGGAFDFHNIFEQIKERVYQAYTVARESGPQGVAANLADVHLEQLPAYEVAQQTAPAVEQEDEAPVIISPTPVRPIERDNGVARSDTENSLRQGQVPTPDEPPPGYEEAQTQAVGASLARRLTEQAERQG